MDTNGQHWIYNTPYIFEGNKIQEQSKRIYLVDKATPLYEDKYLIPYKDCGWGMNYFLGRHVAKRELQKEKSLNIEGISVKASLLKPYAPTNIVFENLIRTPMPFFVISEYFERMKTSRKRAMKIAYTNKLIENANHTFPLFRLILPSFDKRTYYMKEMTLAKLYIKALNISEKNPIVQKLLDPSKEKGFNFAETLYILIKTYIPIKKSSISIYEVNRRLDYLSEQKDKNPIIVYFIQNLTPQDHKWLIMIILKQSLYDKTILKAINPNAEKIYNMTMNLKLLSDLEKIEKYPIKLFQPLKPMLAKRLPIEKVFKTVPYYLAEIKYDGERIQIHKDKNRIALFSRAGINMTSTYSWIVPYLLKNIKAERCIIDGELILWDKEKNRAVAFGWMKPFAKEALVKEDKKQLFYKVFDIIYYDNDVVIDIPLSSRKSLLKSIITDIPKILEVVEDTTLSTKEDLRKMLEKAIKKEEEGLVIKDPNSRYYPGMRGSEWIKIKPQYITGLKDNIDVVIIGGYYSETKKDQITHFLTGIRSDGEILSLVKVGTGFSDIQRKTIQDELKDHWVTKPKALPQSKTDIDYGAQVPDLYIDPAYSRVIAITAHELQITNKFAAGYSLRFPTFVGIRYDKDYTNINTLDDIIDLAEDFKEKIVPIEKPERLTTKKPQLLFVHRPANVENIVIESDLLKDKKFSVIQEENKHDIEKMIYQYGGKFIQNPDTETFAIIANRKTLKIQNFLKLNPDMNIIKEEWLYDSIKHQELEDLEKYKI